MTYWELIEYMERKIKGMEVNHADRWRGDSYYSDDEIARDNKLINQMACTINMLKDQMVEVEEKY